ncbi:MAG: helix-turn-helix domain-containing protein [Acidobacteria bacterium]|nr:helix-turn-helix domain-containing protein [Acidobacteriota bacterium]
MTEERQVVPSPGEGESFGSWLRSQREVRQVELETITQSSKINIRYLEALERDRFDLLPATIFVRGFLREYARIVGLDPDEVLNFYLAASARDDLEGGIEDLSRRPATWPIGRTVAVGVVVVAILLFLVWRLFASGSPDAAEDMETMAPPIVEEAPPPPPPEPLPEQALRVTLEFRATSWVDVHSDGERTVSELRVQGESLTVAADEEIRLRLRNVGAATIEVNGEPFEHAAGDDEEIVISAPGTAGAA